MLSEPADEVLSKAFGRRQRLAAYATAERTLASLIERGLVEREGRAETW
jgi:hypothetical protein